ncbi:MAG TPA: hypothetical protein VMA13_07265 [Candidatus Saccharimonadales bacterium]|nr:hypothetical protein [Candidatus Saccharimonadales bacterium]
MKQPTKEEAGALFKISGLVMNSYIFQRTVVLAVHRDGKLLDHGTGTLLEIEGDNLVVTAAHVVKNYDLPEIQITATSTPSNLKTEPAFKDCFGGERNESLDVAFLKLSARCLSQLTEKSFLHLEDLEAFPVNLAKDLILMFGMPEAERRLVDLNSHVFKSFCYATRLPADIDWSRPGPSPVDLEFSYPEILDDLAAGGLTKMPNPSGMSGGGLWRAHYGEHLVWSPTHLRMIGINTEHESNTNLVRSNRIENLLHLLALHYESANQIPQ